MGTPEFAIPPLQTLLDSQHEIIAVYSQPDRATGRKKTKIPSVVKQWALEHQLPVLTPTNINQSSHLEKFQRLEPDIVIVCAYGNILSQAILDTPKIDCFNIHFSLLPRWRGASPVQAAIKNGDHRSGVSTQKMVYQLDAGPIVLSSREETIFPEDTYESLGKRLSFLAGEQTLELLQHIEQNTLEYVPQKEEEVTFCRIIKKEEGAIYWQNQSAVEIERTLRAFTPWPGIFCFSEDRKRIRLTKIKVVEVENEIGILQPDGMIGCQVGSIQIEEIQPEGKKAMSIQSFLNGYSHLIGRALLSEPN